MKKTIFCLVLCALVALPASAMAAKTGDFTIGGYVKLHTFWDSTTSVNKNMGAVFTRNNAFRPANDGRLRITANDTRFHFKIKGPEIWGAKTQGFIQLDFEGSGQDPPGTVTNSALPRLRHAWFRMDWPGGFQVLMGQYWGVFCSFWPDTVNSGPLFGHGMATQRLPQVRVSKKTGPWLFTGFVGLSNDEIQNPTFGLGSFSVGGPPQLPGTAGFLGGRQALIGERAIMPQFGGQITFEKDLYGKAAFFSRPRGFVASVSAGVQRTKYDGGALPVGTGTWGQSNYGGINLAGNSFQRGQALYPWKFQATLFIPVLTTQTEDLKGTASLQVQFYIGAGLRAFGNEFGQNNNYWVFSNIATIDAGPGVLPAAGFEYNRRLTEKYGGYIQGQYYFNNSWYVSYLYGFSKAYNVPQARNGLLQTISNPDGYTFASNGDIMRDIQEHNFTLFYRPMKAFKFGLSYAYLQTNYFQITGGTPGALNNGFGNPNSATSRVTRRGENHRIQFAGWFFF
jgi:hypothetical protein